MFVSFIVCSPEDSLNFVLHMLCIGCFRIESTCIEDAFLLSIFVAKVEACMPLVRCFSMFVVSMFWCRDSCEYIYIYYVYDGFLTSAHALDRSAD